MTERIRKESAIQTLTAIVDACEGHVPLNCCGIKRAYSDEEQVLWLEMEDGTQQKNPQEVDTRLLEEAIFQWRDRNSQLFQHILGAMM